MTKIKIIADSASDISREMAKELNVGVVPVNVTIDGEHYKDGVDIDSQTFFKKMLEKDCLPKTAQPSPQDYMDEFKKYEDHTDIICIALTSKGSGTYASACLARDIIKEEGFAPNIHVVDSLNASLPIYEMVKIAQSMVDNGQEASEIIEHLEFLQDKMAIYFVVDTLEYIRKGGRIGNVKAVIGTLLKIKPILTFIKGYAQDVDKVRGLDQARKKLVDFFSDKAHSLSEIIVVHAYNIDQAKKLESDLKAKFNNIKVSILEVGTSIGTYTGPGAFGVVFREKAPRW